MKVSLIIPVYKQVKELEVVLENLKFQTYKNFEIIITEDDESKDIKDLVEKYKSSYSIKLCQQEDKGFRKCKALNSAIKISEGDYIIFNDCDCVPSVDFISGHLSLAKTGIFLSGRRVMLGPSFTKSLMNLERNIKSIESRFILDLPWHILDRTDYLEEGIRFSPKGLWRKFFSPRPMRNVLGANFSFFKSDILKINGFDEDYVTYGVGEDNDLKWRFEAIGNEIGSTRNTAVTYHLGKHEVGKAYDVVCKNREAQKSKMNRNEYFCKNGLVKEEL